MLDPEKVRLCASELSSCSECLWATENVSECKIKTMCDRTGEEGTIWARMLNITASMCFCYCNTFVGVCFCQDKHGGQRLEKKWLNQPEATVPLLFLNSFFFFFVCIAHHFYSYLIADANRLNLCAVIKWWHSPCVLIFRALIDHFHQPWMESWQCHRH